LASQPSAALQAIDGDNKVGPLEQLNQPVRCARYCGGRGSDILQGSLSLALRPEAQLLIGHNSP